MMVLPALSQEPRHGYALVQHIKRTSNDLLQVEEGSLYPALQRMLRAGWVKARWETSASGRRVRVYAITPTGGCVSNGGLQFRAHARRHPARPGAGEAMNVLRRLLSRRRLERDLAEEIRQHLDEKIDELVESGMSRDDAIRAAHREFGNATLVEERGRDVWRWHFVEDAWADLRYAARQWRRAPAFAVRHARHAGARHRRQHRRLQRRERRGAAAAAFPGADRLVAVQSVDRRSQSPDGLSYPNFFDFRRSTRTLSHLSCYRAVRLHADRPRPARAPARARSSRGSSSRRSRWRRRSAAASCRPTSSPAHGSSC